MSEVSVIKGARDLRRAFNAALARIIDSGEFLEIKNRTGMNEVIACITCAPDSTQSVFPMKDSLTGRMVDIINVMLIVVYSLCRSKSWLLQDFVTSICLLVTTLPILQSDSGLSISEPLSPGLMLSIKPIFRSSGICSVVHQLLWILFVRESWI